MEAKKRVLKREIEEDDKKQVLKDEIEEGDGKKYTTEDEIEEDDDEMHDIKDKTNGEALEHHGHPQDKALQLDDQMEEEELKPRGMSLSSGTSSRSTAPSEEQRVLPCARCFGRMKQHPDHVCVLSTGATRCNFCAPKGRPCLRLPSAVHANAIRAISAHPATQKSALINKVLSRIQRYVIRPKTLRKSTYVLGEVRAPPCPRSYHTPMTNALRNHDIQSIKNVRDEIAAVSCRVEWEVQKLTERLMELQTEEEQEDLSA
ncbi:hypothetical protein PENPOL_c013G03672 [Penicillium polonicum]|uniref:Uncharacterized protein n=1 Tax=Penicillium polonicum TaxID=60169 RepID=A0A1V6NC87_PENPO|nr:hypothetical protein PENPOL_c013G03672 [Penicillium polonicum]